MTPRFVNRTRGNLVVRRAERFAFELLHELRKRGVWFHDRSAYGGSLDNTVLAEECAGPTAVSISICDVAWGDDPHCPNNFPLTFVWRDAGPIQFRGHSHTFLVTESRDPAAVAEQITAEVDFNCRPRKLIDIAFSHFLGREAETDWVNDQLFPTV